jgi:hypothetical protein
MSISTDVFLVFFPYTPLWGIYGSPFPCCLFHADQALLMMFCVVGVGVGVIPKVQTICHGSGDTLLSLSCGCGEPVNGKKSLNSTLREDLKSMRGDSYV